jgi:hypothetical protein
VYPEGFTNTIANILIAFFSTGWQFVGVFLFLSGFGLTYSRLKSNKEKTFVQHILKFIPLWHIAIVFAFICNLMGHIFYKQYLVQNVSIGHIPFVNSSLWFVVLIIQFYLTFELLFYFLKKLDYIKFLFLSLLITITYRALVIHFLHQQPNSVLGFPDRGANLMAILPARLFEFSLGMFWAHFHDQGVNLFNYIKPRLLLLGALCFIIGNIATWSLNGWIFSDIMTTIGLVIISSKILNRLKNKPLRNYFILISQSSFILFVLHDQPITQILTPLTFIFQQQTNQAGVIFIAGNILLLVLITIFSLVFRKLLHLRKGI